MEQTAVELLVQEINKLTGLTIEMNEPCVIQAKEIERQQIMTAFTRGDIFGADYFDGVNITEENYYNQTFKNESNYRI
jgi:hypothetical protein